MFVYLCGLKAKTFLVKGFKTGYFCLLGSVQKSMKQQYEYILETLAETTPHCSEI